MTKHSILYVDDEPSNLRGFKSLFFTDFNVYTATSGKEGLEILEDNTIHMVISDQKMPEMTGVEFLKEVARNYPEIIRIVLTGYSDLEVIIKAVNECGIFRYLAKPWDFEEMKLTIKKGLESYQLKKENKYLVEKLIHANQSLEEKVKERTGQLDKQNKLLKKLNKDKDDLISIVAHDLRSPLNQICGIINIINMEKNMDCDMLEQYVTVIDKSANRLRSMIGKILDLNAIENEVMDLKLEEIHIEDVFEEVKRLYQVSAQKKGIEIKVTAAEGATIQSDRFFLVQILENLVSNAIKYSFMDKEVMLIARYNPVNGACIITVKDQGPGFSEADKKRIFAPYQKLSAKPTAGESSNGLGLSIVKKYADALNAHISCETAEGKGAEFSIEFLK